MIRLVCPECGTGKHANCNGISDMTDDNQEIQCWCRKAEHSEVILKEMVETYEQRKQAHTMLNLFVSPDPEYPEDFVYMELPQLEPPAPPNDPGIRADSFPELVEEGVPKMRFIPNDDFSGVIKDLYDVEVQNSKGEWVPMVPVALHIFMGVHRCLCGSLRLGSKRYQEHYAYAHILGMED